MEQKETIPQRKRHPRRFLRIGLCAALAVTTLVLLTPSRVYAETPGFTLLDLGMSLKNFVCYMLLEFSAWMFNLYDGIIVQIGSSDMLTAPFNSLLGAGTYDLAKTIHQTAVVPVAESILALFMLVQLIKISQRIDATSTLPAVKEIVFLAVTYVLLHWLIVNSLDIMQSIYSIAVDKIIPQIGSAGTTSSVFGVELSTEPITNEVWDKLSIGGCFMTAITALLSLGGAAIAYLFAFVVAYARAWQVYAMAAFSAIPLALLGFDETRQMGIGFLKNFAAAVLAGAIMMFLFVIYPTAITALNLGSLEGMDIPLLFLMVADGGGTFAIALPMVLSMLEFAGCTVLLVLALGKTGAWAKEILGS